MNTLPTLCLLVVLAALPGCDQGGGEDGSPKGGRLLSIALTEAAGEDFGAALEVAFDAGMEATNLALAWDDLETAPGRFEPGPNFLAIANTFYPGIGLRVALELNPLDTNNDRRPPDLAGLPFDDPRVIARFNELAEWALGQIPNLDVVSLTIGNEVDAALGADAEAWAAYGRFFAAVRAHVRTLRPDLSVGVGTYEGMAVLARDEFQALNAVADAIMVTYYPLSADFTPRPLEVVGPDIDSLMALYPDKPIYFLEAGYPSGVACGGSEEAQAAFVDEVFTAWDRHRDQIPLISFTWLTDLAPETVAELVRYYGVESECFGAFLGTLGLRDHGGQPKLALGMLGREAARRGW